MHFELAHFYFVLIHLENETINTFIRSRSSFENRTRFRTPGQSVYPFSDPNGAKTLPFGAAHTNMAYIREFPTPPLRRAGSIVFFMH